MKYVLLILISFTLISCTKQVEKRVIVEAKIIRAVDTAFYDRGNFKTYFVNLTVTNNSDSIISYGIWSCEWPENWIINSKNYFVEGVPCESNMPIIEKLQPKEIIKFNGKFLKRKDSIFKDVDSIRLGFLLLEGKDFPYRNAFLGFLEKKETVNLNDKHIIRSNNINLK